MGPNGALRRLLATRPVFGVITKSYPIAQRLPVALVLLCTNFHKVCCYMQVRASILQMERCQLVYVVILCSKFQLLRKVERTMSECPSELALTRTTLRLQRNTGDLFIHRILTYCRKMVCFSVTYTLDDFGNEDDEKNNTNAHSSGCCFLDEFAVNGGRLPSGWAKRDATVSRQGMSERLFLAGFVSVTQSWHPRSLRLYI